jgi:NTE family protein
VIATDVLRGEEVRLSEGPLVDAVMASAAIPGVLPAVDWAGRELIDGGVANNAPLTHALELGADEVYVLPTGAPCELDSAPHGALAMLVYATSLLVHARLANEIAALAGDARITVLPPPCPLSVAPTDFGRADELIEQARSDARSFLDGRASGRSAARGRRPRTRGPLRHSAPSLPPGGSAPRSRGSGCPGAAPTAAGAASSPQSSAGPTSA